MKYKVKEVIAKDKMDQLSFNDIAKAHKQIPVLAIPSKVIADATSAQLVGKGSLCRVEGSAGAFIAFGDSTIAAPSVASMDAIKCPADFFYVIATDDFIRTSAAMRIEVISD